MNKTHLQTYTSFRYHLRTLSLSGLLLCIFLLSACSGATTQSPTTTTASTGLVPAVDLTLQNEGNVQLQAYHQSSALMPPYQHTPTPHHPPHNTHHPPPRSPP